MTKLRIMLGDLYHFNEFNVIFTPIGIGYMASYIKKLFGSDVEVHLYRNAEKLVDEGKEVYLLELDGKDPSEMGFKEFHRLMNKSQPLTLHSLMKLKISLL